MQMNSLIVRFYTTIIPWLITMNSVSTPISQAYDSLAIVKMSQPEKNQLFPKNVHYLIIQQEHTHYIGYMHNQSVKQDKKYHAIKSLGKIMCMLDYNCITILLVLI